MAEGEGVNIAGARIPWWGLAIAGGGILALWTIMHRSGSASGGGTVVTAGNAPDIQTLESNLESQLGNRLDEITAANEAGLTSLQQQESGDIIATQQQSAADLAALRTQILDSLHALQSQADQTTAGGASQAEQIQALYSQIATINETLTATYNELDRRLRGLGSGHRR